MIEHNIRIGDEVVVQARNYFIEEIDTQGNFFAVGDDGEEMEGNLNSIDAHFPANEEWSCF
jgi:tricorn protease-like protein